MQPTKPFIRFAAICCFVSVITTLGIHLYFPEPPAEFEQRALLHKNTLYLLNRWWVILHCLLVIVAMWGFALVQWRKSAGTAGLGFLFFALFGIAEITRQLFVLFYMNELRVQYVAVSDIETKQSLRHLLTYAGLLTAPLFGLFIFSFALGNLCYGISLWGEKGFARWLGILLVIWAVTTFVVFANNFWKIEGINKMTTIYNYTYQPLLRLLIGIWLWQKATAIESKRNTFPAKSGYQLQAT